MTVKTTSGPIMLQRPKLRGTDQRFASTLLGTHVTRTNALEALVIAGFVRGLSTRDVEASLAEALGPQAAVSRSTVSRICDAISGEFTAWSARSLADVALDYLYLDGTHFRYHPGARAEPVLVAYGITATGSPVFLGLTPAGGEGHDPWVDFLDELTARGLRSPVLVISDGAAGLISAVEQSFPAALRQRCVIHRARNVLAKVPTPAQAEVKAAYWQIFDDIHAPPGEQAVAEATRRAQAFAARYQRAYPAAVACLTPRWASSLPTFASHANTGSASATPICSSGPSARPADGPRSSAGCPARPPACGWSGPCWTAPAAAGAASPTPRPAPACSKTSDASSSIHQPTRPSRPPHNMLTRSYARPIFHHQRDATLFLSAPCSCRDLPAPETQPKYQRATCARAGHAPRSLWIAPSPRALGRSRGLDSV